MLQDFGVALRSFARQRGFFVVAVLTIALGVALTTTIFSVADNLLYRPLPYAEPQRLYEVFGAVHGDPDSRVSGAAGDYLAWRESGVFSSLGVFRYAASVTLTGGGEARQVLSVDVDDHFLPTLGVVPAIGRAFAEADGSEGARPLIMISYSLWQHDFGGDLSAIGRTIDVNNKPAEIVGVLPAQFIFPASVLTSTPQPVDILRPLVVPAAERQDHNNRGYRVIGRLPAHVGLDVARGRLDAVQAGMKPLFRPSNVRPGAFDGVLVLPLQSSVVGRLAREAVRLLFIAAFGVLVVAAVNVAHMLLARGADRERELAVRAAMGASRRRLARLLLVESTVVSAAGGVVGLLLAKLSFGAILARMPQRLIVMRPPEINMRVAVFAMALSLCVGVVFGLVPAVRLSRTDFMATMKKSGAAATRAGGWGRDALVFAEVTLAVMLVGAGALVLRSFVNVLRVDVGMEASSVLTLQVTPPTRLAPSAVEARAAFFRQVQERVRALPGVEAAALTDNLLLQGSNLGSSLSLDGVDWKRIYTRGNHVATVHVTPEYFRVMGMRVRGSAFPERLTGEEPMAIASERVGRYAGVDPIGRDAVSLQATDAAPLPRYRIVGVAADVHERSLDTDPLSVFYLPFKTAVRPTLLVRSGAPAGLATAVREAVHSVDRTAVVDRVRTLDDLVSASLVERRFDAFLYGTFSLAALALSALGIYGVVAYAVSKRTREIGIRVALGATPERVVLLVTTRMAVIVAAAMVAGAAGLLWLGKGMQALVFNLSPTDPLTFLMACGVLAVAALTAAYLPTRRATRVDPMVALRAE